MMLLQVVQASESPPAGEWMYESQSEQTSKSGIPDEQIAGRVGFGRRYRQSGRPGPCDAGIRLEDAR